MCCVDRLNPQPKVSVETLLGNVCLLRNSYPNRIVVDLTELAFVRLSTRPRTLVSKYRNPPRETSGATRQHRAAGSGTRPVWAPASPSLVFRLLVIGMA